MKILLVTSEALPYCKSGGLGDFVFSYAKALSRLGQDVSVILPLYLTIRKKHPEVMQELYDQFDFRMSWRTQGCGLFHTFRDGVHFYFTAMDRFDRDQLYGYGDDTERFACFVMAVNTFLARHNDYDVVHCNDWQTGVLPLLLRYNPRKIKTVYTIHNPAYQGWASRSDLGTFFNLPLDYYDSGFVRLGDSFNYLKTGIMSADKVNTVSRTHARELLSDHSGFGGIGAILDWCRHYDFTGIVNGLDTEIWNPKTDPLLPKNYGPEDVEEGKKAAKESLFRYLGWTTPFRGPLYAAVTRLSAQKGVDRLIEAMNHLKSADARYVVIGTGEDENRFLAEAFRHPEVYFVRRYDENLAHLLYAASDYFLMPSYFEPCGTSQMIAMRYGSLPVVSNVGGLNDTVKDLSVGDTATGFVFDNGLSDAFANCMEAANRFFAFDKEHYKKVQQNGMKGEYGWEKSAKEYLSLYASIRK